MWPKKISSARAARSLMSTNFEHGPLSRRSALLDIEYHVQDPAGTVLLQPVTACDRLLVGPRGMVLVELQQPGYVSLVISFPLLFEAPRARRRNTSVFNAIGLAPARLGELENATTRSAYISFIRPCW